jgi:hypothetical protein
VGIASVTECFATICKILGSIPSIHRKKKLKSSKDVSLSGVGLPVENTENQQVNNEWFHMQL